jgi:hypothetical protein
MGVYGGLMYYPYLRGKQYELITLKENADLMGNSIVPIIEPVRSSFGALQRAIRSLIDNDCRFILVANPRYGDLQEHQVILYEEIRSAYLSGYENWSIGCIADNRSSEEEIRSIAALHDDLTVIHAGHPSASDLAALLEQIQAPNSHVFIEATPSKRYRRRFTAGNRVLIRDGFESQRRNIDYPDVEHFSELHLTYEDEGVQGFGDFLVVGDDYSTTGGPAYTVAIHITFLDPGEEDDMFIRHFKSDSNTTPADPGGKFAEALNKLVAAVNQTGSMIFRSSAIVEFLDLHARSHFPGLGYVKKLSMQHHIELMDEFLGRDT